jgi:hypothetical protein
MPLNLVANERRNLFGFFDKKSQKLTVAICQFMYKINKTFVMIEVERSINNHSDSLQPYAHVQ